MQVIHGDPVFSNVLLTDELKIKLLDMRGELGKRLAINSVVQGSAADLIKLAMIQLPGRLADASPRSRLLLQIHDELVIESPQEELEAARTALTTTMESAMEGLRVPLVVDVAAGPSWFEAK